MFKNILTVHGCIIILNSVCVLCVKDIKTEYSTSISPSHRSQLHSFFLFFISGVLFTLMSLHYIRLIPWRKASRSLTGTRHSTVETVTSKNKGRYIGELKLILVVRNELKMGKGKIGAQCGHAVLGNYRRAEKLNNQYLQQWIEQGQKKVVVKSETESSILALNKIARDKEINTYLVHDAGLTQIIAGSLTVLAIGPAPETILNEITGDLKLL